MIRAMWITSRRPLVLLAAVALAACGSYEPFHAELTLDPEPVVFPDGDGYGTVVLSIANTGSEAITIESLEDGRVSASGIDLFMIGYWEVHVDLTAADESWTDRVTYGFCVE